MLAQHSGIPSEQETVTCRLSAMAVADETWYDNLNVSILLEEIILDGDSSTDGGHRQQGDSDASERDVDHLVVYEV